LLRRQLRPVCNRLGLCGITWHSLRHSHATLLDAVGDLWEPCKLCSVTPLLKLLVKSIYTLFPTINVGQWRELKHWSLGTIGLKRTQL
jgi:hypothetical protein